VEAVIGRLWLPKVDLAADLASLFVLLEKAKGGMHQLVRRAVLARLKLVIDQLLELRGKCNIHRRCSWRFAWIIYGSKARG
jgi:hypothetical protein